MPANDERVPEHYEGDGELHWDRQWRLYGRGYFVGCATKYVERYHKKEGLKDLRKAIHFIEKLIELEYPDTKQNYNPEFAPLASFPTGHPPDPFIHPQVKPTGWVNFSFEGTTVNESLFTCRRCRQEVRCPVETDPGNYHTCPTS